MKTIAEILLEIRKRTQWILIQEPYPYIRSFLGEEQYFKLLSLSVDKKILLDETCRWLKPLLEELKFTAIYTMQDLDLPTTASANEIVFKLHNSNSKKQRGSGFLLITCRDKTFNKKVTANFDILVIPKKGGKNLAANIKSYIQFVPLKPQGTVKLMISRPSPHNSGYDVGDMKSVSILK
jgi:hypothetical protein